MSPGGTPPEVLLARPARLPVSTRRPFQIKARLTRLLHTATYRGQTGGVGKRKGGIGIGKRGKVEGNELGSRDVHFISGTEGSILWWAMAAVALVSTAEQQFLSSLGTDQQ